MGEHNAEEEYKYISSTGSLLAVGATVAVASLLSVAGAGTASASPSGEATDVRSAAFSTGADLDTIAECESSGNPRASNGSHFGLFQFDLRTWASVGGKGDPRNASVEEQYARASALLAARGTQPWAASAACQARKSGHVSKPHAVKPSPKPRALPAKPAAPKVAKPVPTPIHDEVAQSVKPSASSYPVVRGDTLSAIAELHGVRGGWQAVYNMNRDKLSSADLIYPGQILKLA